MILQGLRDTKAGDEVGVRHDGRWSFITKAKRTTKTQILIDIHNGIEARFRRRDGLEIGSAGFWGRRLVPLTPEHAEEIKRQSREDQDRALASKRLLKLSASRELTIERVREILAFTDTDFEERETL